MPSIDGRVIGIKLKEADFTLNLKLKEAGFDSLSDMVRGYLDGSFIPNEDLLKTLSEKVAARVVQRLTPEYTASSNQE